MQHLPKLKGHCSALVLPCLRNKMNEKAAKVAGGRGPAIEILQAGCGSTSQEWLVTSCCVISVAYGNQCARPVACVQAMVVVQEGNAELLRNSDWSLWTPPPRPKLGAYFGAVGGKQMVAGSKPARGVRSSRQSVLTISKPHHVSKSYEP